MRNWRNYIRIGRAWTFKKRNVWIEGWNKEWKLFMKMNGGYTAHYGSLWSCIKTGYKYLRT